MSMPDKPSTEKPSTEKPSPGDETTPSEVTAEPRSPALTTMLASLAVAGAVGAFELWRSSFQRGQVFHPTRYPEGDWDPGRHGLDHRDIWFRSADGTRLHGWWIAGPPRTRATVLYCHGNSGSLGERIEIFATLRRLGVHIFAFDYRGYGKSDPEPPSETGLFQDVRAAHDVMTGELGVEPSRIILFGHSLGGAVATDVAIHRPAAGLVVQSSFTDLDDMARHFYPGRPIQLICRNAFRSIDKVGTIKIPKLFLHGTADETVPFTMGERLFAAAASPKAWFPVAGAGHNDLHVHGKKRYFRVLARFRERCVG